MPNSGSGDPTDPLGPVAAGRPEALGSTEAVAGPDHSAAVEGPAAAQSAAEITGSEAIASALASGEIDPATARAQLIEQAVRTRLPPDATPDTVAAIRAEVEAMVGSAPVLERLLRP